MTKKATTRVELLQGTLVSSGLMLRSFQKLRAIDPGFDAASALTFRVGLPPADYPDRDRTVVVSTGCPRCPA